MHPSDLWRRPATGRPIMMGILNVTPDSFSDGGTYASMEKALEHAYDLIDQGADILDIGGESTRPGSDPVSEDTELERVLPVIKELALTIDIPISVDTMKPRVAAESVKAGASIINDIFGLRDDKMIDIAISNDVQVVIMHMYGIPKTIGTHQMKGDFMEKIRDFLNQRAEYAVNMGLNENNIILDPGIGFGKTSEQNIHIIENSGWFGEKYPVLIGPSRKRFLSDLYPNMDRDKATAMAAKKAVDSGARLIRVHNVSKTLSFLDGMEG